MPLLTQRRTELLYWKLGCQVKYWNKRNKRATYSNVGIKLARYLRTSVEPCWICILPGKWQMDQVNYFRFGLDRCKILGDLRKRVAFSDKSRDFLCIRQCLLDSSIMSFFYFFFFNFYSSWFDYRCKFGFGCWIGIQVDILRAVACERSCKNRSCSGKTFEPGKLVAVSRTRLHLINLFRNLSQSRKLWFNIPSQTLDSGLNLKPRGQPRPSLLLSGEATASIATNSFIYIN